MRAISRILVLTICCCLLTTTVACAASRATRVQATTAHKVTTAKPALRLAVPAITGTVRQSVAAGTVGPVLAGACVVVQAVNSSLSMGSMTRPNGTYHLRVAPGDYFLTVSKDGFATVSTKPTFITVKGTVTRNINLKKVQGGFRGTVLGISSTGQPAGPIKNADLTFYKKGEPYVRTTRTDAGGRYGIWLQPGSYEVQIQHDLFFRALVPDEPVQAIPYQRTTKDLHFKRKPPKLNLKIGRIIGYVWERTGPNKGDDLIGPVPHVEVTFTQRNGTHVGKATTKGNGNYYETLLPFGTYDATMKSDGFIMMQPFDYEVVVDEGNLREDWYMQKDLTKTIK